MEFNTGLISIITKCQLHDFILDLEVQKVKGLPEQIPSPWHCFWKYIYDIMPFPFITGEADFIHSEPKTI